MKTRILLLGLLIVPAVLSAQFEQKVSLDLSFGTFKTFGEKVNEYEPMQMPNYKIGFSGSLGLQFKFNKMFSLTIEGGMMTSQRWSYHEGDNNNYLYWSVYDTLTGNLIAEGEDYLDIHNYYIGIKPKYYLKHGGKWRPYFYSGLSINWTNAWFENNYWTTLNNLNMLLPDDPGPFNGNLETSIGIGINPGFGVEYVLNDKLSFSVSTGYYFMTLDKKSFKSISREENFNAFVLQAGIKFGFIKSKDL